MKILGPLTVTVTALVIKMGILCTLLFVLVLQNAFIAISIWSIVFQEALLMSTRCSFIMRIANGLLLFEDLMAKLILNVNMTILFGVAKTLNKTSDIFFIA